MDTDALTAHVVWEVFEESGTRAPLGLVVAVPDTTVAAWLKRPGIGDCLFS
ncbi:MAG: hypothetical protein O3B90_04325 [Actinomycetota bacterium]|nr:hypothetical protein [Actinomycetota bacterium]